MAAGAPKASCCIITGVIFAGALAFALSVVAESKRAKASPTQTQENEVVCNWTDGSVSWRLAWLSMSLLVFALFTINLYGGCVCCHRGKTYAPGRNRAVSIIFLSIAWVLFACSEIMLLTGAVFSSYAERSETEVGVKCVELREGTFAVGGLFGLFSTLFASAYYSQAMRAKYLAWASQGVIQMSPYPVAQTNYVEDNPPQFTLPSHSTAFPAQPGYPPPFH
eukprot:TRINITY_DN4720_c0_g1_i1.p1 TRINITY_DN4720_c0_g1~~TRINITY_DN4720_c0_g1_i1.p1  ORF type:complete len:222 (-),score=26.58 TRINITY_DN4720_c0_g1_i1:253-918(-)